MSSTQDGPDGSFGVMKTGTYAGRDWSVHRTDERDSLTGHNFAFRLFIDGAEVTTASEIESNGWSHPWIPTLQRYAKAYIDG